MYTDSWFTVGATEAVKSHLDFMSSSVYFYLLQYRGSSSFTEIFGDPKRDYGVCHADELQYLFPVGERLFPDTPLSDEDNNMIDLLTSLWFNFAKTGYAFKILNKFLFLKSTEASKVFIVHSKFVLLKLSSKAIFNEILCLCYI